MKWEIAPVAGRIEKRLKEFGIVLPAPVPPFNIFEIGPPPRRKKKAKGRKR